MCHPWADWTKKHLSSQARLPRMLPPMSLYPMILLPPGQ